MFQAAGKTLYTIKQADIDNQFAIVPFLWSEGQTFTGGKEAILWSIEDTTDREPNIDFFQGDIHDIKETGFSAVVYIVNGGDTEPGDHLTIHAAAFIL